MARGDVQASWAAYQESLDGLYERPVANMAETGEGDVAPGPDLDERVQTVIESSKRFGEAAAETLVSDDPDEAEMAQLQLLAAAATDLAVANDLARQEETLAMDEVAGRDPVLPNTIAELRAILEAPTEDGAVPFMEGGMVPAPSALPSDARTAREALKEAAKRAVADVRNDAASGGQLAFVGLVSIPAPPLTEAAEIAVSELLQRAGEEVGVLLRRAARLVVQAIDKILKAIGKKARNAARRQALDWIKDLEEGTLLESLLTMVYETERIQQDVDQQVDGAPDTLDSEAFNAASRQVGELAAKFRKQKTVITLLIRGLAFARPWMLSVTPWGPLALATGYVGTIGYFVYAGGDYVDWFRTGTSERLDFVAGVRTTVRQALV